MGDTKKELKKEKPEIIESQTLGIKGAGVKNVSGQLVSIPYDYRDKEIGNRKTGQPQKYLVLKPGEEVFSVDSKIFDSPAFKKLEKEGWVKKL